MPIIFPGAEYHSNVVQMFSWQEEIGNTLKIVKMKTFVNMCIIFPDIEYSPNVMQMFSYNNNKSGTFWELLAEYFVLAG